jgi:hypothetical protein
VVAGEVTTPDGISTEDWDIVHELIVDLVNAEEGPDEEECRHRFLKYLDELEDKYGARPSILATRADFIVDDVPRRLELFSRAYALAAEAGDARNQLHVASSLAELYIEELTTQQEWPLEQAGRSPPVIVTALPSDNTPRSAMPVICSPIR